MRVNEQELERLDLYLDRELGDAEARDLEARVAGDLTLAAELDRLRGDRAGRLSAMSVAFDTDAASVERLVASVRAARASEALQLRRRASWLPMRSVLAAAACVAFGLTLGVTLQRQHGRGGVLASPALESASTGGFGSANVSLGPSGPQAHGAFVVSVKDSDGREVMRVRFYSQQQAQAFIDRVNRGDAAAPPVHLGDARILDDEAY